MFFPFACVRVPKCADEIVMTCPSIVKGPRANHAFSEVIHSMCPDQNSNRHSQVVNIHGHMIRQSIGDISSATSLRQCLFSNISSVTSVRKSLFSNIISSATSGNISSLTSPRPYLTEICFLQGRGSQKLHWQNSSIGSGGDTVSLFFAYFPRPYLTEICFLQGRGTQKLH